MCVVAELSADAAHGCTTLRYYGPKGWRCVECWERFEVQIDPERPVAFDNSSWGRTNV